MSSVVPTTNRPVVGRALIVGSGTARAQPLAAMQALGYECAEADDPYTASAELFRRPLVYRAMILSLTSLFREELAIIGVVRRQLPHIEIWLTHIDGRQAALVEALGLGAAGLLSEDGQLHSFPTTATQRAATTDTATSHKPERESSSPYPKSRDRNPAPIDDPDDGPMLTAEELKALLERPDEYK